jgi:hypothetical protein
MRATAAAAPIAIPAIAPVDSFEDEEVEEEVFGELLGAFPGLPVSVGEPFAVPEFPAVVLLPPAVVACPVPAAAVPVAPDIWVTCDTKVLEHHLHSSRLLREGSGAH